MGNCASAKVALADAPSKGGKDAKAEKVPSTGDPSKPSGKDKGSKKSAASSSKGEFQAIKDSYETLEEVSDALRTAGLESSNLVSCCVCVCGAIR